MLDKKLNPITTWHNMPTKQGSKMTTNKPLIFLDIETNGLLESVSKLHCIGYAQDSEPAAVVANEQAFKELLNKYQHGFTLVGHNIIGFDLPALTKLYGFKVAQFDVIDTLVLARYIFPDTSPEDDKLILRKKMPARLMG